MRRIYAIGVDLGATNIRVALGDANGRIIKKIQEATTRERNRYALSNQITSMIKRLVTPEEMKKVRGIGIGSIGPLDIKEGKILLAPNLNLRDIPLAKPISEEFNRPVYVLNDCVAAVVGEKTFGAGKGIDNLVYVTISTGIGCGVYVNGHLLLGKDGNAHEVGHIVIDYEGRLVCGCGKKGHWEAYCSGRNIPRFAKLILEKMPESEIRRSELFSSKPIEEITSKDIYDAAKRGDPVALKVVEEVGRLNAIGIANIINAYDPTLITLGGSVTLYNEELVLTPIKKYIGDYVVNRIPKIMITPLRENVVLYGAIAMVFNPPPIPSP
ncbi:MAG: ROK family protein [Thermoprotei archaeon]|nr:ROK family protein [Thermoprotei archaeon]